MKKLGAAYLKKAARSDKRIKKSIDSLKHARSTCVTDLDFRAFIKLVMPTFVFYQFSEILIDRLEEIVNGDLSRLIVQVPPRHGKSQLVSRLFPAYYLLKHQARFVAVASYGATLAEGFSRSARAFYTDAGGKLDPAAQSVKIWQTEQGGGLWSASVGSAATGRGCSLAIVDDPLRDRRDAESPTVRGTLKDWYGSTFRTRVEPEEGAIVIIQTRWHEDDLIGQVLENEAAVEEDDREGWHVIDLPAIAEEWHERPPLPDCISVEEDFREVGEALCPQRYNLRALSQIRAAVGSREWSALYMQSPRPSGGNIIDPDWFLYYTQAPEKFQRIILSVDCTFKDADSSDFVAMIVMGQQGSRFYVLDVVNERLDIVATMTRLMSKVQQWNPQAVLVEAAANGHAVLTMLRQKIPNMVGIKPADGGSKINRVQACAPMFEAGNVWLPQRATWTEPFVSQATMFPAAKNDDMIDATAQALNWATKRPAFTQTTASYGYGRPT